MSSGPNQPNVSDYPSIQTTRRKRGARPKPIIEFPEPNSNEWNDPACFSESLMLHMDRHGDTIWHLHRAIEQPGESFNRTTIRDWRAGRKFPRSALSLSVLDRIERRYRLPSGYFRSKLPHQARAATGHAQSLAIDPAERRRLAWHLPDDFDQRPLREREEILEWVRRVIISGSTDLCGWIFIVLRSPLRKTLKRKRPGRSGIQIDHPGFFFAGLLQSDQLR